jgi:hypothetical protein
LARLGMSPTGYEQMVAMSTRLGWVRPARRTTAPTTAVTRQSPAKSATTGNTLEVVVAESVSSADDTNSMDHGADPLLSASASSRTESPVKSPSIWVRPDPDAGCFWPCCAHHGDMRIRRITTVLGALLLGTTLAAGTGRLASPALADPVDTTNAPTPEAFAYLPLWPFPSQAEADRWLRDGADSGPAPWHADPRTTALRFAQDHLGFAEIDRTTIVTEHVDEAWVGVGYASPNGEAHTAARIHLARFGAAPNAPWEVVGSLDDTLTLSAPSYGSVAGTEIDAGGVITGVDESLHLQLRQNSQEDVLGEYCCVPAGGESRPWSATFSTSPPQPGALTLVVWTGGHSADVERFAVTGLRAAS